jgi:hypothetical protein
VVLEPEPVPDVGTAVTGVVDVDVVARLRVELVEVRPTGRVLERNPVRHDRQRVLRVGCGERVDVGVVTGRIDRGERRFPVAGAEGERNGHRDRQ